MNECRICGCTDQQPCMVYDEALGFDRPCYWVEPDVCSACAGVEADEKLLEGMLDLEALRALRRR